MLGLSAVDLNAYRGSLFGCRSGRTSGQVVLGQVVLKSSRTSSELVPESTRTGLSRRLPLMT